MINVEKIEPTGLFTNYIYKAIPLAFDESMSYYETLCGLLSYLKDTVIPALNNNADAIIEVQELMTQLQNYVDNYFENLDVQEEINNKLDEMVEDGTLQEIIASYLDSKAIFGFDTVALMKQATNLINGSYAQTYGFYSKNDGGSALYKIRNITNDDVIDNMFILAMENDNLVAELIINDLYVEQLGAKGDGITDDTTILQNAINYCITNQLTLKSRGNKTFLITSSLNFNNKIDMDFNNSTIITNSAIDMLVFNYITGNEYQGFLKNIVIDMNSIATIGIHCIRVVKKLISGITIKNISGIGYQIDLGNEVIFENSHLYGNDSSLNSIGLRLLKGDCHYKDLIMIDVHTAIWSSSTNFYSRIHAWIKTKALIPDSIFMKCDTGSTHFLNQCYSDTYGYSFYVSSGARIKLTEHYNFNNANIMTPDTITANGGYIYMFYYTDKEYSRYTTISNSRIQGYPDNLSLAKFTNINYNEILSFVDALTYVSGWYENFKNNYISITSDDITGDDFNIVSSYSNKFIVSGNVVTLNLKVQANKFIASGTATKIGNIPQKYRPQTETVFIVPTSLTTYGVKNIAMIYILTNGDIYFIANGDSNTNDIVLINHTYITVNNQP